MRWHSHYMRRRQSQPTEDEDATSAATPGKADEADGVASEAAVEVPRKWHEFLSVRVVLFLVALFAVLHLFLWKVVYDFWMSQNHDRLRGTVHDAVKSLYAVVDHL